MTAMSNYLENKLIDHLLRGTSYSQPDVYVGLVGLYVAAELEAGTLTNELSGGSYARVGSIRGDSYWSAGSTNGLTDNENNITFTAASNEWGHVSGVFIADAASTGNVLLYGPLTIVKEVENTDQFIISAGDFDITFA
tara:strand:- start:156 stop:569 length:414 start_codon:yes stop_codon:yes gene_type:complete